MRYKKYEKNKMVFWVYSDKIVIKMSALQTARYDIYTTANKRNFYTFKKELLKILNDSNQSVSIYDVLSLGKASRINGTVAKDPVDE